ncbi:DNA-3-methyladenine glycosylase family protein [Actinomadura parmotrematis]|uniref:DNA-3-methyladenine glycosylase II n=1 Tax=Actinomadura parmotrematis TaxID=2864039 RepID=A0ABS7G4L0_9ACTN|nr:hypothetical protein [Actinomadura parmotrematis]MBW8487653.1 hypothetical protein [Actinomadura parmotrematis]
MRTETVALPATAPFAWRHSLRFAAGFKAADDAQRVAGDTLTRALRADGRNVVAVLAPADGGLTCTLHGPELPASTVRAAADRLAFAFSLDDDLTGLYALGANDPDFAPIMERLHGYHQVKFATPLENAVWAILAQRTALPVAVREKNALTTPFADTLTLDGARYTAFPDVEQLASLKPGEIAELVRNRRKGEYVAGMVRGWLDIDEDALRHAPYQEAKDALLALPGIGAWSAAFILLRGLGRTDETPDEKQLADAASRLYGRPLSREQVQRMGARYGPWQGYWAHYLRAAS